MNRIIPIPAAVVLFAGIAFSENAHGQLPVTAVNTAVTQNFDALLTTGTNPGTGGIFSEGWSFLEGGAGANTTYTAGAGTGQTGDTYSFGVAGINPITDRAFGMLQSGSLTTITGFKFTNNTGREIAALVVRYTGEVWRINTGGDKLSFSYQIGDVPLANATGWIPVTALDFATPVTGTAASVDGNDPVNRTVLTPVTIYGLSISNGATVTFRWVDATPASSAGMAIDDFSLTLVPASTDYFRTRATGTWNSPVVWEQSADNLIWQPSSNVPTSLSAGVTVQTGHTITIDADLTIGKLAIQPGAKLLYTSGILQLADSPGDDLVLLGENSTLEIAAATDPVLLGAANVRVGTGAVLLLSGNNNLLRYHTTAFTYADGAIMEYSAPALAAIAGTFFQGQDGAAIPILRYSSAYAGNTGGSGATTINGLTEVTAGKTWNLNGVAGLLVMRNGITGAGNMQAATTVVVNGATAVISGTGTINSNVLIENGCTTTLEGNKTVSKNNLLTVNGTLNLGAAQLQSSGGTASVQVNATGVLQTANPAGLIGTTASFKTGNFSVSFAQGATVDYNANGNQVLTTVGLPAYQNLRVTGTGTKTAQGGANLVVQGSCEVRSGTTLLLTGNATENLYLNNNATLSIAAGATFDTGGESAITTSGGTPAVQVNGTFITRDQQGFTGPNASLPSIIPVLTTGCTINYGRPGDQTVQATLTYENISFSGSGTKTPASAISLNGTVTISGPVVLDGSAHTIGGTGNNLVMTGTSRYIVGGTGTRPSPTGSYSLAPATTLVFSNTNTSICTIRQGAILYANIEITGTNITAPPTGVTLQPGATFTVKNGGVFKVASAAGLLGASNTAILITNNPTVVLEPGSTIDYSGGNQVITTGLPYSNITISGSGTKTAAASFSVQRSFTRSGSASLAGAAPAYAPGAGLSYTDAGAGRTYLQDIEWPVANPPSSVLVNLSGTGSCTVQLNRDATITGNLSLISGSLDLGARALTLNGGVTGNGTLKGSTLAELALDGGTALLRFDPSVPGVSNALKTLSLRSGSATLASAVAIHELLDPSGGTLDVNGQSLTLKSGATKTARVGELKGTLVGATSVTVERWINGASGRRWRLLTAPVSGTSLNKAWQEGRTWNGAATDNGSPGNGTLITGEAQGNSGTANAKGFDFWTAIAAAQASVRTYQGATDWTKAQWVPLTSTLTTSAFDQHQAYLLFVRGDRSVTTGAGATVLRSTGSLKEQAVHTVPLPANQSHVLVGNPFASPLNLYRLWQDNPTAIQPWFWTWQASLGTQTGGYVLLKPVSPGSSVYEAVPDGAASGSLVDPVVSSGEGFFVVPINATTPGSIFIRQEHKWGGTPALSVFRQADAGSAKVFASLYATGNSGDTLLDGALAEYGRLASNNIRKPAQVNENLSILKDGIDLSVASVSLPQPGDTLWFRTWNTTGRDYRLKLRWVNGAGQGTLAVLVDQRLNRETVLDPGGDGTLYNFSGAVDNGSQNQQRFYLVFRPAQPLPVVLTNFSAAEDAFGITLTWTAANENGMERYEVEKGEDGSSFYKVAAVAAMIGTGGQTYSYLDRQPAPLTFYRIRIVQRDGLVIYSGVVQVNRHKKGSSMTVFPNPVTGPALRLQFVGQPAGTYHLVLYNISGQQVSGRAIQHPGGTMLHTWSVGRLASGSYTLEVTGNNKKEHLPVKVVH